MTDFTNQQQETPGFLHMKNGQERGHGHPGQRPRCRMSSTYRNSSRVRRFQGYSGHKKPFAKSKKMLKNNSYHVVIMAGLL